MTFENRHYVIISTTEINNINFNEVLETSAQTCRYSTDGSKFLIKYQGETPPSVSLIVSKSQEYSHTEILNILNTEEWTVVPEEI